MEKDVHDPAPSRPRPKKRKMQFIGCFALSRPGSTEEKRKGKGQKRRRDEDTVEKRSSKKQRRNKGSDELDDGVISISSRESSFDATSLLPHSARSSPPYLANDEEEAGESQKRELRSYLRIDDIQGVPSKPSSYASSSNSQSQHARYNKAVSEELEEPSQRRISARQDKGKGREQSSNVPLSSSSRPPSSTTSTSTARQRVSASPAEARQHSQTEEWLFGEEITEQSQVTEERIPSPAPLLPDADLGEDDSQIAVQGLDKAIPEALLTMVDSEPAVNVSLQDGPSSNPAVEHEGIAAASSSQVPDSQEGLLDTRVEEDGDATIHGIQETTAIVAESAREPSIDLADVEADTPGLEADKRSSDLIKIFGSEAGDIAEVVAEMHPIGAGDKPFTLPESVEQLPQNQVADSEEYEDEDIPIKDLDLPSAFQESNFQIPDPADDSDYLPPEEEEERERLYKRIAHSVTPELEEVGHHRSSASKKASPRTKILNPSLKKAKQDKAIEISDSDTSTTTRPPLPLRIKKQKKLAPTASYSRSSSTELEDVYPLKSGSTNAASVSLGSTASANSLSASTSADSTSDSDRASPEVFAEESDTSDDARYKDASSRAVREEIERAKRETKAFFPSSSLTPMSHGSSAKKQKKEKAKIVRGRLTAAQKGKGREELTTTTTDGSESEDKAGAAVMRPAARRQATRPLSRARPITLQSGRRSTAAPPLRYTIPVQPQPVQSQTGTSASRPFRPTSQFSRSTNNSISSLLLPAAIEANPASYTRSRTSSTNPNANSAQCHRCEAFQPKMKSLMCVTCSGAVCQRCMVEHYSDQPVYVAISAYLVGQFKEELKLAKSRQKKLERGASNIVGSGLQTGQDGAIHGAQAQADMAEQEEEDMNEDNFPVEQIKKMFTLPSSVDLSSLDFQCPVCKLICMCANCLRGPYPKGHPRHKASLLAAATAAQQATQPIYEYEDSFAGNDFEDEVPIVCASTRLQPVISEKNLNARLQSGSPGAASSARRASSVSSASISHSQTAYDQVRAYRAQIDEEEEMEYIPVVASRPRPTVTKPKNVVPRLGSPPPGIEAFAANKQPRPVMPTRRSARVRLATTVGQQLGKSPANIASVESPKEPVFTFTDGTISNEVPPAISPDDTAQGDLFGFDDLPDVPPRVLTPEIQISIDEANRLVSAFTSLTSSGDEADDNLIPDFAMSAVGSLPELDQDSPSDTLTITSASSLASPSANNDDILAMSHDGAFPDLDTFMMQDNSLDTSLSSPFPPDAYFTNPAPPTTTIPAKAASSNNPVSTDKLARAKAAIYLSSFMTDDAISQYISAPTATSSPSKSGGLGLDSPEWGFGFNEPVF